MAQTKHEIQSILEEAGAKPRQKFGQNFMIDGNLVRIVAQAGEISPGDLVIEVGPGTGTLTQELLATGAQVLAVEIDSALAEALRGRFSGGKFELIHADALAGKHALNESLAGAIAAAKSAGKTVRLVANLPYNIASPLVIELLIAGVDLLAFTVQKEVADRLRAVPNTSEYGTLSIVTQLLARVEVLRTLPPQAFWPMPRIESALVRLRREDQLGARAQDFGRFVQKIFSARRKTMRKAVELAGIDDSKILAAVGIDPKSRPEQVTTQQFLQLFEKTRPPPIVPKLAEEDREGSP
jgi:16S rRNA (adenine1518-N6/adenine1519-N6)-dimethyltransferase